MKKVLLTVLSALVLQGMACGGPPFIVVPPPPVTPHRPAVEVNPENPPYDDPGWDQMTMPPAFRALKSRFAVQRGLNVKDPPFEKREAVASEYARLKPYERHMVLRQPLWRRVQCAGFLLVFEPLLKAPAKPEQDQEETDLDRVVMDLCDLHSKAARQFLMEDMQRPRPLLSLKALRCLPAGSLPEVQDALARDLEDHTADYFKVMPLVARYGAADLLPQVKALCLIHEGRYACSIAVAALQYWIKHEPKGGLAALARSVNARESTGCFRNLISETLPAVYSPQAEQAIMPFLDDPDITVALDAAGTICRCGSLEGRRKVIQWLDRYPTGTLVKSISDQREWNPREHIRWELSEGRAWPFDGHTHPLKGEDLVLARPLFNDEEWKRMLDSVAGIQHYDEEEL